MFSVFMGMILVLLINDICRSGITAQSERGAGVRDVHINDIHVYTLAVVVKLLKYFCLKLCRSTLCGARQWWKEEGGGGGEREREGGGG